MASPRVLYDNRRLFILYGLLNLGLLLFLLALIILLFNEIYILSRTIFVLLVGIQTFMIFFLRLHFMQIKWDEENQTIGIVYNKNFGIRWRKNAIRVVLPLSRFDGYSLGKDSLGLPTITTYKLENKERFELGPFHIGYISKKEKALLGDTFGEPL
jgi:hypothetical protein